MRTDITIMDKPFTFRLGNESGTDTFLDLETSCVKRAADWLADCGDWIDSSDNEFASDVATDIQRKLDSLVEVRCVGL